MLTDKKKMPDMLAYHDGFADFKHFGSELMHSGGMVETPKVSIMIPTYKRPELLKEAIESALNQKTNIRYEVVVVDNDNDQEIATEVDKVVASFGAHNLRLFRNQSNIGMFGNWNRCVELARGQWLTILNDDDLLDPTFLAESWDVLDKNKSVSLVACKARTLDDRKNKTTATGLAMIRLLGRYLRGKSYRQRPHKLGLSDYFLTNPHCGSLGILMARKAALAVGGFSQKFYPSADYIFFVRFVMSNDVSYLPRVLATYRIGVNESLKTETCVDWIHQNRQLREEMIPYLNINSKLLRYYSRLWSTNLALSYRDLWKPDFNVSKALSRDASANSFGWAVFVKLHILRVLLNVLFLWASKQVAHYK